MSGGRGWTFRGLSKHRWCSHQGAGAAADRVGEQSLRLCSFCDSTRRGALLHQLRIACVGADFCVASNALATAFRQGVGVIRSQGVPLRNAQQKRTDF